MIYFPNKFFKKKLTANEMFAKLGFTIDQDNPRFGTHYSRYNAQYGYLHKVSIIYKHPLGIEKPYILVQSYQYDNDAMVGLTDAEMEALTVIKGGVNIKTLNIGSMAHSVGKVLVNKVISMGKEDVATFKELKQLGIKFDVRKVPADGQDNLDALLQKAEAELK